MLEKIQPSYHTSALCFLVGSSPLVPCALPSFFASLSFLPVAFLLSLPLSSLPFPPLFSPSLQTPLLPFPLSTLRSAPYTKRYTWGIPRSTLYARCALRCALCALHYALYFSTLYPLQSSLYRLLFAPYFSRLCLIPFFLYSTLYSLLLCSLHFTLYSSHSAACRLRSTLLYTRLATLLSLRYCLLSSSSSPPLHLISHLSLSLDLSPHASLPGACAVRCLVHS